MDTSIRVNIQGLEFGLRVKVFSEELRLFAFAVVYSIICGQLMKYDFGIIILCSKLQQLNKKLSIVIRMLMV